MKNLLIFTLCVVFSRGFPMLGGYQQIDIIIAQQDTEVQALIKGGLQEITDQGLEKEEFSSSNFKLTKINSVSKQIDNVNSYMINCEFVNDEDMVVTASFQAKSSESTPDITNLEYKVQKATEADRVDQSFMQVSSLEAQFSSEISDLTNFGTDQVVKSISDPSISDKSYQISKFRSVSRQVKETALFYKFNLQLKSDEDNQDDVTVVETNFTVYYQPLQNIKSLTDYIYAVVGEESEDSKPVVATIIMPEDSGYMSLPDQEVNDDDVGKAALDYGREDITIIAINDGKIPNTTLEVLEVTQAENQIVGNGMFYKFSCRLGDQSNVTLTAVFSVYIDMYSYQKATVESSYQIENEEGQGQEEENTEDGFEQLSADELQSGTEANNTFLFGAATSIKQSKADQVIPDQDYTLSNVTRAEKKSGDKGNLYRFGYEIEDQDSKLLEMNSVVYYQFSSQRRILSSFSHKTKEAKNDTSSTNTRNTSIPAITKDFPMIAIDGDYVPSTQEEIDSDSRIITALNYGSTQVSIRGIQEGTLPPSNFTIKNVISVSIQSTTTIISYRCKVVMENQDNINFYTTFTVFYDLSTEESSLSSYFYAVDEGAAIDSQTQTDTETTNTTTPETQVANTGYIEINNDEIKYSGEIQSCIKFGAEQIIPKVRNYTLTKINKVSRKVVESTLYYKCEIELNLNNTVAQLSFTVFYQPDINQKDVIAYSYKTRKSGRSSSSISSPSSGWWKSSNSWNFQDSSLISGSDLGPSLSFNKFSSYQYSKIPISTVDTDPDYKNLLNYGVDQCIDELKDNKVLLDSKFDDPEVLEAYNQEAEDSQNCKFKVKLTNSAGISLNVTFNVQKKTDTGNMNLTSYSCEGSSLGQTDFIVADYGGERGNQLQVGNYEKIIQKQLEVDPVIQQAIDYGVEQVKYEVEGQENIDSSSYSVNEVTSIYRGVADDSSYRVDAILENDQGSTIDCSFVVKYQSPDDKELELFSYVMYTSV